MTCRHPLHEAEKTMCRYCIQQYQKVRSGKVSAISKYCPLKLFDSPLEQLDALCCLFQTPQNNLVFSIDGCRTPLSQMKCCSFGVEEERLYQFVEQEFGEAVLRRLKESSCCLPERVAIACLMKTMKDSGVLADLLRVQVWMREGGDE